MALMREMSRPLSSSIPRDSVIILDHMLGCNLPVGGTPASLYRLVACLVYFFPSRVRTKSSAVCAPVGNTCFFLNKCNISEFSVRPTNIPWPVLCHRLEGTTGWVTALRRWVSDPRHPVPETEYYLNVSREPLFQVTALRSSVPVLFPYLGLTACTLIQGFCNYWSENQSDNPQSISH
ncbi:hypothetical protein FKM82_022372 [Ascaphus truei]